MKYYITFETQQFAGILAISHPSTSEHTWVCTEEKLEETLKSVAANKHKVIRIIRGEAITFTQEIKITSR